jgi:hypothetical protein
MLELTENSAIRALTSGVEISAGNGLLDGVLRPEGPASLEPGAASLLFLPEPVPLIRPAGSSSESDERCGGGLFLVKEESVEVSDNRVLLAGVGKVP